MSVPEHAVHYLEIVTPDVDAMCSLCSGTYGWEFAPQTPELGNAFVAELPGGSLCGIRAPMHPQEKPLVRTYFRVTDIEASVQEAAKLGARIDLEPVEIPGHGKIAIYSCGGIEQGVWEVA